MKTIVAPSTPFGRGAIAIIRLSGPDALHIAQRLAPEFDNVKSRHATLSRIRYPNTGEPLDEILITYFKKPLSVTGEDVVEISCHGSPAVVRQIIDLALSFGAQLAGPGEFTLRALKNGKINLTQAEAIRDLIGAQTKAAVKQAARQVGGELSQTLKRFEDELIKVIVALESALEFVEDDLPPNELDSIEASLAFVREGIESLADSYAAGRLLQDGVKVAIVGSPNVGKSSLFNRLAEFDRAIVTPLPGTTRDTLSHSIDLWGIPVVLIDTAGLRDTADSIESLGIERTKQTLTDADLVLEVIDGTGPFQRVHNDPGDEPILVINKCDLQISAECAESGIGVRVSALTGEGLNDLRTAIFSRLNRGEQEFEGLLITNARHHDLLTGALMELEKGSQLFGERASEELVLVPLHNTLKFLGQITGETTTEELLTQVFSTFCIGK